MQAEAGRLGADGVLETGLCAGRRPRYANSLHAFGVVGREEANTTACKPVSVATGSFLTPVALCCAGPRRALPRLLRNGGARSLRSRRAVRAMTLSRLVSRGRSLADATMSTRLSCYDHAKHLLKRHAGMEEG